MKKLILISMVIVSSRASIAQDTEFTIHANGLIYNEQTMARLGYIVDSLNLKFKTCEAKDYHSLAQGFATKVVIKANAEARQAMNNNVDLKTFLQRFPNADQRREWIVKYRYTDYRGKKILEYSGLPLRDDGRVSVEVADRNINDKSNGWVYQEHSGNLIGLYLEDVKPRPIPGEYAQLIQYVDCMIDTTARIYLVDEKQRDSNKLSPGSKITQYLRLANDFDGEPEMPKIDWDSPFAEAQYNKFAREYKQWDNARIASLDKKMAKGHYYKSLLIDAANEAIELGAGDGELEFYTERYISPEQALKLKRLRQPVGYCSQDQTPRLHAQSICRLAAETTQWDIFLRAHLDIMNDNFERQSDGSYAWAGRGTYLRELEELDINALDLLIGTSLRASNVAENHYLGDIGRVGRALSETRHPDDLERRLLAMVEDEDLDLLNRLLIAYLFDNYNYYLQDEVHKKDNVKRLLSAVSTLPDAIGHSFEK